MTRILVLNHYPVLPARNGGQHTVRALARELALDWPVELIWTERKAARTETVAEPDRQWQVTVIPNLWAQRKAARFLRHFVGRIEADFGSLLFCGWNHRLVRHLVDHSIDGDVFYLAHPWLWPAVRRALRQRRAIVVYDAHNVEYLLKQEALAPTAVSRWFVERTRRMESEIVTRADLTLACTPRDADELARLSGVPRAALLVGVRGIEPSERADVVATARRQRAPGRRALFVGSKHPPNDEAARWIIEVLAPDLPGWHFDIAGSCGPTCGSTPRTPNVSVLGHVEDISALMFEADVGLNPIVSGSGINMKLFEYMQHGLPVLSTPFGVRGLEAVSPNGIRVAELARFATDLREIGACPALARELSMSGERLVRDHFTWPSVGRRLRDALASVLRRQCAAA